MTFVQLIILLLACSGMTFTFVHASIMDKIGLRQLWQKSKFLTELFHCSLCSGFWIGVFYGLFGTFLTFTAPILFYIVTIPFAASAFSFLFERFTFLLDDLIIYLKK